MRRGRLLCVATGLGLLLTGVGACGKRAVVRKDCPDGMSLDGAKSQPGKFTWCRSADGQTARYVELYDGTDRRQSCGYRAGRPEGTFLAWHRGGASWIQGEYLEGRKTGRWTQWDKDGRKVAEGEYRNGDFIAGAPVGLPALCEKMKP